MSRESKPEGFVHFAHVKELVKKHSSKIGDMWNDRENFKALIRKMNYGYHKHMTFLWRRQAWDEISFYGILKVPRKYYDILGIKEENLRRALEKDQKEYLEAVKRAKFPEYYFFVCGRFQASEERRFPEAMGEEQAVEYVLEKFREWKLGDLCEDRIVFPYDVKRIFINSKLEWEVIYRYPDMETDRVFYYFLYIWHLPEIEGISGN